MQTEITKQLLDTPHGREAESILRKCVHCGFCTATCPTYQLLGDELDGPRGRIYLIKQVLEGQTPTKQTQLHLDRCLTCRSCETTCPSGVNYARLLDIGREAVEASVQRPMTQRLIRRLLRWGLSVRSRFNWMLRLGQMTRPFLFGPLRKSVPPRRVAGDWPNNPHTRTMLVLQGCVQPGLAPQVNAATARVLDRLGIRLLAVDDGCCGALSHHLSAPQETHEFIKHNIDAWWPYVEQGCEAIVMTASGCGSMVKEYGYLMQHDPQYAEKAARISEITLDISEVLCREDPAALKQGSSRRLVFHAPCSLQHGQKLAGKVETLLRDLGHTLLPVADAHLCCGSAGTYSILQKSIANRLKANKLEALCREDPEIIVTANIGCQMHLESDARIPVQHWIELLDQGLTPT